MKRISQNFKEKRIFFLTLNMAISQLIFEILSSSFLQTPPFLSSANEVCTGPTSQNVCLPAPGRSFRLPHCSGSKIVTKGSFPYQAPGTSFVYHC